MIKKVTQIATSLVTVYGMNDKMGLVSYNSGGEMSVKAYSDETTHEIDLEVKKIVDDCYARTKELLLSKKDLIGNLAEELLVHESMNLPKIIKVLGDRPFPMKDSVKEYLQELETREKQDQEKEAQKEKEEEQNHEDGNENDQEETKEEKEGKDDMKKGE